MDALTLAIGQGLLSTLLIIAILIVLNILLIKFITWIITSTVIDTWEARGYGKGTWKK